MLALLLLAFALPAFAPAEPTRWQQVALFDWVYPGETAYADLKQAAIQAQAQGWVVERIRRSEALPQASARELAWQLQKQAGVDEALKARLKAYFDDEAGLIGGDEGDTATAKRADDVSAALDRATAKMDELEASMKANHYGKGSTPALNLDLYSGYRLDSPSGLRHPVTQKAIADNHAYLVGGMLATFLGTLDKINFAVGIGSQYVNGNGAAIDDYEKNRGQVSIGASFQFPLAGGGLDVGLGQVADVYLSPLLFSTILPPTRDAFFVDVTGSYRPSKVIKTMELGYPAATRGGRGIYVKRQGAMLWWPFTTTQFIYTPSNEFWESWDARLYTWTLRLDEDLGPRGSWLDGLLLYGLAGGSFNYEGQQLTSGGAAKDPQSTLTYSLGTELRFSNGTTFKFDGAASSYERKALTYVQSLQGTAWIGTLIQPVGPFYFALEGGAADPTFITKPTLKDRLQAGATIDSMASVDGDTSYVFTTPKPNDPTWITVMKDPTVLTNNTQRAALKAEWHGSWVSLGLYDGVIPQIKPTGAYVMAAPYLEGRPDNGFGWHRVFGQTYGLPPGPGTVPGTTPGGPYAQGLYNLPTAGIASKGNQAIYGTNPTTGLPLKANVHWQQISQLGYKEAQFTVLLSEKGLGDPHVMADSAKTLNYAGGNLQFDLASLFGRSLAMDFNVVGEVRDLSLQAGAPVLDDSGLFNQQVIVGYFNVATTETLTLLAMAGYETWKTKQSYYPVNIQVREFGAGADLNLDPLLTGLKMNFRGSVMTHEDLNFGSREFSLLTASVGSTLSY